MALKKLSAAQSVVHELTGTTKLAFFLLFTFASMITYNTWVLLGLMAVSFCGVQAKQHQAARGPLHAGVHAGVSGTERSVYFPV